MPTSAHEQSERAQAHVAWTRVYLGHLGAFVAGEHDDCNCEWCRLQSASGGGAS